MISKTFPATHPRKGEPTNFIQKIWKTFPDLKVSEYKNNFLEEDFKKSIVWGYRMIYGEKRHTIRGNYDFWKKRADKINKGEAVLSLRQWTGSPYNFKQDGSKQVEFLRLTKLNIQKVNISIFKVHVKPLPILQIKGGSFLQLGDIKVEGHSVNHYGNFYKNDGLNYEDFLSWFGHGDHKNMAILHFNENFKY